MDRPRDPFDDLADLFLTPEEDGDFSEAPGAAGERPEAATPAPDTLPPIAVAVAGHLPVSAGLWLSQLADRLARDHGPTGLVRFVAGQVHIEVFRAGTGHDVGDPLDLHEALHAATTLAERWIVVPESSVSSGDVLRAAGDGLMLLTGADEAAVVAAYRLLKDLAEESMVAGRPMPPISVGVLGAGDVAVASAMMKLHRTADAFLSVDLPLAITMPRMEPLESSLRFMLPAPRTVAFEDVPALLRRLVAERGRASGAAGIAASPNPEPADPIDEAGSAAWPFASPPEAGGEHAGPPVGGEAHGELADSGTLSAEDPPEIETLPTSSPVGSEESAAAPSFDEVEAPEATAEVHSNPDALRRLVAGKSGPWSSMGGRAEDRSAEASPVEPAKLPPHPIDGPPPRTPPEVVLDAAEDHEPLLGRFEELTPLPVACPYHPRVELGVDAAGRLHLVASHHRIAEVEATAAWLADHAALLRLACPGISTSGTDPIVDLVTERPSEVVALQHSRIRLHLVARVTLGSEAGWLRLPLNSAAETSAAQDDSEATPEGS